MTWHKSLTALALFMIWVLREQELDMHRRILGVIFTSIIPCLMRIDSCLDQRHSAPSCVLGTGRARCTPAGFRRQAGDPVDDAGEHQGLHKGVGQPQQRCGQRGSPGRVEVRVTLLVKACMNTHHSKSVHSFYVSEVEAIFM